MMMVLFHKDYQATTRLISPPPTALLMSDPHPHPYDSEDSEDLDDSDDYSSSMGYDGCPDRPTSPLPSPSLPEAKHTLSSHGLSLGEDVASITYSDPSARAEIEGLLQQQIPFVVRGAGSEELPMGWDDAFWEERYGDRVVACNARHKDAQELLLSWYLEIARSAEQDTRLYLRNLHLLEDFPDLLRDDDARGNAMFPPSVLTPPLLPNLLPVLEEEEEGISISPAWIEWVELFISGIGTRTPLFHVDVCSTHAWSGQIQGRKRFFVAPPSATPHIYPDPHNPSISSIRQPDRPNLDTYPEYAHVPLSVVDLDPGDILFIPPKYWHAAVTLTSPSITVAGNFVNALNRASFLHDLQTSTCM